VRTVVTNGPIANDLVVAMACASAQPNMAQWAHAYADAGFRVIPLHAPLPNGGCTCGRTDCEDQGKHPRISDWTNAASDDHGQIDHWFLERWPNSNIGLLTGNAVAVLDVDDRAGGDQSLIELVRQNGPLGNTLCAATGGHSRSKSGRRLGR
jgi:hypothetical protein